MVEKSEKKGINPKYYVWGAVGSAAGGLLVGGLISYQVQQSKLDSIEAEHEVKVENIKDVARETVRDLDNKYRSTNRALDDANISLRQAEARYSTANRNLVELRKEHEGVLYLNDSLNNRLQEVVVDLYDANNKISGLNVTIDSLTGSLKHSKDKIAGYQKDILNLNNENELNRDTINKFQMRMHEDNIPGWFQSASNLDREILEGLPRNFYETRQDRRDARSLYRERARQMR